MRHALRATIILVSAAAACRSGVHDLEGEPEPLVTIRGTVSGSWPAEATNLRVGLLWAGVPVFVPYCHERGPNPLYPEKTTSTVAAQGCRDPFDVVPGMPGPSVPLTGDTFEIELMHLPSAEVLVGPRESRVAYASLIVFDDRDEDEELDLRGRCPLDLDDRGPRPMRREREPVYASSFATLTEAQTRLAYVEGPFDRDSTFYPHPNCTALPPAGFSIWEVGELLQPSGDCSVRSADEPITLSFSSGWEQDHSNVACRQQERESFERPPELDDIDASLLARVAYECTDEGAIALTIPACDCPDLRIFSLFGCYDEVECENPDWDLRDSPPEWWPCPLDQ